MQHWIDGESDLFVATGYPYIPQTRRMVLRARCAALMHYIRGAYLTHAGTGPDCVALALRFIGRIYFLGAFSIMNRGLARLLARATEWKSIVRFLYWGSPRLNWVVYFRNVWIHCWVFWRQKWAPIWREGYFRQSSLGAINCWLLRFESVGV